MSISLRSNIAALKALSQLGDSTQEVASIFERLSSGLRINRASDDAAGLAVASTLKADTRVYSQAIRNISDAISLLAVADNTIGNLTEITVRQQELAEQAANGTLSALQRAAIDAEAQQLSAEFNRLVSSTSFNGLNPLDGSISDLRIQAGKGAAESLAINLENLAIGTSTGASTQYEGDGTFNSAINYTTGGASNSRVHDFNNDGNLDLVITEEPGDSFNVFLGNSDGSFKALQSYYAENNDPKHMTIADFNGDGYDDLAVTAGGNDRIAVFLGNTSGDGSFLAPVTYALDVGSISQAIIATDFNNDGKVDLAVTQFGPDEVRLFEGDGLGGFSLFGDFSTDSNPDGIASGDINGSGGDDLILTSRGGAGFEIRLSNGDGTYTSAIISTGDAMGTGVEIGDFDGDGFNDIIGGTQYANRLWVAFGNGNGSFTAPISFSSAGNKVSYGDLNGDGEQDFISSTTNGIQIFLSTGNRTYDNAGASLSLAATPNTVGIADFDGDNDLDLFGFHGTTLSILLGNGGAGPPVNNNPAGVGIDLGSVENARTALSTLDDRLSFLATTRGKIGAFQSRLDTALSTVRTKTDNYAAALSRIQDADVAFETANLVRNSILQQTAAAVLGQANQIPQLALRLLS